MKDEIILYQIDKLAEHIKVRVENETVWLNRQQIATLFDRDVKTIGKHIANVLEEELKDFPTVAKFATVQNEGSRKIERMVEHYNLDMIISVGYRVKSKRGIQFRIWANSILKDYLLKGYSINNRMNRIEDLAKKKKGVQVFLLTKAISKALELDVKKANEQYGNFQLKIFTQSHDRFLIIDNKEVYHLGASLKDLEKKWFAFSKMDKNSESIIENVKLKIENE
jgi:hypothetical protein